MRRQTPACSGRRGTRAADRGMVKGIVKATRDGNELFVKTVYRIQGHRLKAAQAKGLVLRESQK